MLSKAALGLPFLFSGLDMQTIKDKALADFKEAGLDASDWRAFYKGYLLAIRRFGGVK